jgi:hypothetical protein
MKGVLRFNCVNVFGRWLSADDAITFLNNWNRDRRLRPYRGENPQPGKDDRTSP